MRWKSLLKDALRNANVCVGNELWSHVLLEELEEQESQKTNEILGP